MDKISSILPSSPRIKNVDLRDSGASRPGMPSFGRPVGTSELSNPSRGLTTAQKAVAIQNSLVEARSKTDDDASIVQNLSNAFFMKRTATPPAPDYDAIIEPEMAQGEWTVEPSEMLPIENSAEADFDLAAVMDSESEFVNEQELDLPIVGRYLDVSA